MTGDCNAAGAGPLVCPDKAALLPQVLALLPRGRAWGQVDGTVEPDTVIARFWAAVAEVYAWVYLRLCALRLEFWCATQSETNDLWMAEYGLPDACDPFPDLCTKVAAIGGTRCDYYAAIAARAGWDVACVTRLDECGASAGRARAGRAQPGRRQRASQIRLQVFLPTSPAYTGGRATPSKAGRLKAGRGLACAPDIDALRCIIERIVHADIEITYEAVSP